MTKDRQAILPHQRGFTLIEIMVTLVIIGIAAALVSPAIMEMAPNMALKSAAQDLYSNLQRAKVTAIKENSPAIVVFNAASYFYYIDLNRDGAYTAAPGGSDTFTDNNGDGMYNPDEPFVDVDGNNAYSGEIAVAINFNDYGYGIGQGTGNATADWVGAACAQMATVQFTGRGLIANPPGPGSVYIQNSNADISYAVSVLTTGSVKGRKYNGATPFNTANWVQ